MSSWPGPVEIVWGPPGDSSSPWRLVLRCRWGEGPPLVVCGLNPSTANTDKPDPTCVRWLAMAQRWGFSALTVVNCYPLRATSPKDLEAGVFAIAGHERRQVGRYPGQGRVFTDYLDTVSAALDEGPFVLACWGAGGAGGEKLLRAYYGAYKLAYLHKTAGGDPIHPLARLPGVRVSELVPLDWVTGQPLPLPRGLKP